MDSERVGNGAELSTAAVGACDEPTDAVKYAIHSKTRGDQETFKYLNSKSKPIIDEIDTVLAQHYGFTAEELDFIINYDIKYRLGRDTASEEE